MQAASPILVSSLQILMRTSRSIGLSSHLAKCWIQCQCQLFPVGSDTITSVQWVYRHNSPLLSGPTSDAVTFHPSVLDIFGHPSSSSSLKFRLQQEPSTLALLALCLQGITFTFFNSDFYWSNCIYVYLIRNSSERFHAHFTQVMPMITFAKLEYITTKILTLVQSTDLFQISLICVCVCGVRLGPYSLITTRSFVYLPPLSRYCSFVLLPFYK